MDKSPEFRIVGGASEEKKQEAKKDLEKALFDHFVSLSPEEKERLEKLEYPKSEKEIALIDFANKETNRLREECGLEPYDIQEGNYHIIPPEFYKEVIGEDSNASTSFSKQGILFNAEHLRDNPVKFGAIALHENLHLKGHVTMEVEEDKDELDKTLFREGVTMRSAQKLGFHGKHHLHFVGLHEAIVTAQEKKSFPKILELPVLKDQREWLMSDGAKELKEKIAKEKEIPMDEFISVRWLDKEKNKYESAIFSYLSQRQTLDYVCQEIQKEFPEQYKTSDDAFKEFLRGHFTGRMLPIARLTEKTFGEGSFRLLGNMKTDNESGVLHLESLKKARLRQKR